jgi:hypothetical protein
VEDDVFDMDLDKMKVDKNNKNTRHGSLPLRAMQCNHATCLGKQAFHAGAIIALRRLHRQRTTSGHKPAFGINRCAVRWLFLFSLFFLTFPRVRAQNDPTLAGLVILYTEQAKKELKNQEKVMLLESTGHIWTKEEVEATTDLQREFNTYLDSFRSIVCYAAQIYGFYHEISRLTDNMGDFTKQLSKSPTNAMAVALSSKRNTIYRELIMNSIEIVNDIRTVCLSDNKMTEKERMEIVFGIRPKLKQMNKKLQRLTKAVKYTTMTDVWNEIDEGARPKPTSKKEIAEAAKRRWKHCGKTVGYPTSHRGKGFDFFEE